VSWGKPIGKIISFALAMTSALLLLIAIPEVAHASTTYVDTISAISCTSSSAPTNTGYGIAVTAGSAATITTIKFAVYSHTNSSDSVNIYPANGANTFGTKIATFNYSSTSSGLGGTNNPTVESFTGSFNAQSGSSYYFQLTSNSTGYDCYDSAAGTYSNGWSFYM
jgi:hypothetical protein